MPNKMGTGRTGAYAGAQLAEESSVCSATAARRRRLTPDPHKHPSRGAHSPLRDLVPPIRLT